MFFSQPKCASFCVNMELKKEQKRTFRTSSYIEQTNDTRKIENILSLPFLDNACPEYRTIRNFWFQFQGTRATWDLWFGFSRWFFNSTLQLFCFFSDSGVVTLYEVSSGVTPNRPVGQGWKIQK